MSYTVLVQPSGHTFSVEANETILDGALRHGFAFPYGCRNGACGSCKGKLLSGTVDHGPSLPPALSEDDIANGQALFCVARATSDISVEVREVGAAKDIPIKTLPCRLAKKERLAHDVIRIKLKLPATERLQFLAGQYIDILLKDGKRRSFSLANAPHDDELLELHIRHVVGGRFTDPLFSGEMQEKALLRLEGPLGSFFLREDSERPMIMLAGGTGFAPIKAIVEHAIAEEIHRPIHIYWGVRAKRDLYLAELPQQWAETHDNIHFTPVLSEPMEDDNWQGRTGFVHEAVLADFQDLSAYEVYACGPPVMISAAKTGFSTQGLDPDNFYSDAFEIAGD